MKSLQKLQRAWPAFDLRSLAEAVQHEFETPGGTNPFPLARRLARLH